MAVVFGLMLWPPPTRGERVALTCACQAKILFRFPWMFAYYIRVERADPVCARKGHADGQRIFVMLETIASRTEGQPSA